METNQIRQQENQFKTFIKKVIDHSLELGLIKPNSKIELSSTDEDSKLSFDLIYSNELHISVRLRKYKFKDYNDFTIRNRSNGCGRTEIDKLEDGLGYIYFYGYLNENETKIIKWVLFYIDPLRKLLRTTGKIFNNKYDLSQLKVYDFQMLVDNNALICYGFNTDEKGLGYIRTDKKLKFNKIN